MTSTRTTKLVLLAALLGACTHQSPAPDPDGAAGGKHDSFFAPTEHGLIEAGEERKAMFTDDESFHAWDFTLSGPAEITATTTDSGAEDPPALDTVLYLYKRQADGSFGRYLERNDDLSSESSFSQIRTSQEAGSYRLITKLADGSPQGVFALHYRCSGDGCAPGEGSGPTFLRVPLVEESGGLLLSSYNDRLEAAGFNRLGDFATLAADGGDDQFSETLDYLEEVVRDGIGEWIYPLAYVTPRDYELTLENGQEVAICYGGDQDRAVSLASSLADSVLSDQFVLWAYRYGTEQGFEEGEDASAAPSYGPEWTDYDPTTRGIVLVHSTSDSGEERDVSVIFPCEE